MLAVWSRLPVLIRAVLAGALVSTVGVMVWSTLVLANQRVLVAIPWAIVPTSAFLWLFWRYLRGEGWPSATSERRRASLRANPVSPDMWGAAIFAGMLGWAALVPLTVILGRLVALNPAKPIALPDAMPFVTGFVLIVMASIVAGVVEEAAFRGYMQGPIERRHGPVVAILVVGAFFGLGHFNHHGSAVLAALPFYLAVAAIYGTIAYLTNSIWPSLVLHSVGNVFSISRTWLTGRGEWEVTASAPRLIWDTGPDAAFWGSIAAFIVLGGAAVWAFAALANVARETRSANARLDPARV